jgi:hypothetical protein
MFTREELIADPNNWESTEGLNLEVFEALSKKGHSSYYLRIKNKGGVYYGGYNPEERKFIDPYGAVVNPEDVSHFISLPPITFKLGYRYLSSEQDTNHDNTTMD